MKCEYDALALDYHWLVGDQILAGESFLARHRSLFDSLSASARILDCACGIGSAAIGLARCGYQVTASDASGSMVTEAERRARAAAVDIRFVTCQWEDLPGQFQDPFDLVLCIGNSISHTPNRCVILRALAAMRAVLKSDGALLVDSRNWEKMRREQVRVTLPDSVVERDGMQCMPLRLWDHQIDWNAPHRLELFLIFEQEKQVSFRRYMLTYRPVRYLELRACIEEVGFTIHRSDYSDDADWYEIEGKRRDG
jgi:glycine/sarcosine N-methyltransferase